MSIGVAGVTPPADEAVQADRPHPGASVRSGQWLAYLGWSFSIGVFSAFNNFTLTLWLTSFTSSYFLLGLLGNSKSFEGAIVSPLMGAWSDRTWAGWLGRRRPFILVGGLLSALLFALTPAISRWAAPSAVGPLSGELAGLIPTIVAIFLFTLTFNSADDVHRALLADVTAPSERNQLSAWSTVVNMAGQVGILVLGFLLWHDGVPDAAFAITGLLVALGALVTVVGVREPAPAAWDRERHVDGEAAGPRTDDEDTTPRPSISALLTRYRGATAFCLVQFAYWSGVNAVMPLVSIYTRDILGATVGEAQLLPGLLLLSTTVFALPMGRLGDRYGKRRVMSAGFAVMGLAALAGLVITTREQGAVVFLLAGVGNAANIVLTIPLLADLVPRHRMGVATGALAASGSIAAPVSSLAAGWLSDLYGPRAIFALMTLMVGVALALMPFVRNLKQPLPDARRGGWPSFTAFGAGWVRVATRCCATSTRYSPFPRRGGDQGEGLTMMLTNLYDLVRRRAEQYPDAIAVGGQHGLTWKTLTSRQLLELVDRLADELATLGVRDGDRVVFWAPSHWQTPVYHFALWKLGAIVVPFDREMNPEAAERIVESVEPRCILVGYGERPPWARGEGVVEWWGPGTRTGVSGAAPSSPDTRHPTPDTPVPDTHGLAMIVFTSGTTGAPKGCMISHANLCSQVEVLSENIPLDPSCRLASILPLSHLFELTAGLLYPLSRGSAIHYIPSRRGPDILRILSEQRITHMVVVPQLLALMGRTLDDQLRAKLPAPAYQALHATAARLPMAARRRLFWPVHRKLGGHLRMIGSGGAALPAETQLLWERLGIRIVQGYGASECSPIVAAGAPDGSTPIGSVGKPIRGVQVRLSPEGELLVHGPNVMRGYWRDPERTAEVLQDGWYATGDLAQIDPAGNIRLAGRARDLIALPSGLKVWPQDVEDALRRDPTVKDAAVIAVPSPRGGAKLHAYLLPGGPDALEADLKALIARANGRLAQHQRVATASWWPEPDFPRTSTLKVRRMLLLPPDKVAAIEVDSVLASDDPVGQAIAGAAKVAAVRDEQTLGDLGLDSLGLVELALALEEKTGLPVGDGDLNVEQTVAEVRGLLAEGSARGSGRDGRPDRLRESVSASQPLWPYTWGRAFRFLSFPFDLLYRWAATRTVVLGGEHLERLPPRLILAGTHHSFADFPLIWHGLAQTPARRLVRRLVVAVYAGGFAAAGRFARYGVLAFGLYPLRQYGDRDASLRGLARLAAKGNAVLIFPQGMHVDPEQERSGDPEARFRPGVAHLAVALEATVIPFGVAGTERVMPHSIEGFQGLIIVGIPVSIRRGPMAIAFGPPLAPEPGQSPQAFTARLQEASYALTRQAEQALADPRSLSLPTQSR